MAMKRSIDIVGALLGLVLLSPLLVASALAVLATSRGGVFYRQLRIGRRGVPFVMLKYRSMVQYAEAEGGWSTRPNDPRVTRIGRLLRRTSIDELPQLYNVLRGDMSLVGPRPLVPAQEFDHAPAQWAQRCEVRPGVTGLAQVNLRSEAGDRRIELDLVYIRHLSITLDIKILLATIGTLSGRRSN